MKKMIKTTCTKLGAPAKSKDECDHLFEYSKYCKRYRCHRCGLKHSAVSKRLVEKDGVVIDPGVCYHKFVHNSMLEPEHRYECIYCGVRKLAKDPDACNHDFEYHHKKKQWLCCRCGEVAPINPYCSHSFIDCTWSNDERCEHCGLSKRAAHGYELVPSPAA